MTASSSNSGEALRVLKEFWGYDSFRPGQLDIICSAMEGRDVLGILPTGGGKSICFQVPAMCSEGIALVITPLIALMKDQVEALRAKGIKALCIHSGMSRREVELTLNNAAYGDFKFLYISPERLNTATFKKWVNELPVNYIIVDEAHCISQWGYDFRPDYLQIAQIRQLIDAPVIALTATATEEVSDDIMLRLAFPEKNLVKTSFERKNLAYICRETVDKRGMVLKCCQQFEGTGIVYVRSRKMTEELAAFLKAAQISADFYHAGMTSRERNRKQKDWIEDRTRVMVCTNAFGMGIDKPDVRFVLHFGIPESPESYFQEAGRAGRDGKESRAIMFWNSDDCKMLRQQHTSAFPPLDYIEDIYHKVHASYDIAYESGIGRELRFDLSKFCQQYRLNRLQAYSAIKYLDRCGQWSFMEDVEVQTRVMISVDNTELYNVLFPEEIMRTVLDVLMRRYEGIFSSTVYIDEEYVAAKAGTNIPTLRQTLYKLSLMHVLRYVPSANSDIIFLRNNRLHPKDVNLKTELYGRLIESSKKRTEAMIAFVRCNSVCRSRQLLEYFGQTESEDCGKCDVCTESAGTAESLRRRIDSGDCPPLEI